MEETPENQYQTQEPHRWQTGDLLVRRGERSIILDISSRSGSGSLVKLITQSGLQTEEEYDDLATQYTLSKDTGLRYQYAGRMTADRDFTDGLFTACFEPSA